MKHCPKCNIDKPLDEFGDNKSKPDGKQHSCKECRNTYLKSWYVENKDLQKSRVRQRDKDRAAVVRKLMYEFYLEHPCVDCGEKDPIVLECDHFRDKKANVSEMLTGRYGWEAVKREIDKCQVRCANCHRRKTARERGWYKHTAGDLVTRRVS